MSKKKQEKSNRPRAANPESYGDEILAALERAGAPLTRKELVAGISGGGRERAAFEASLAELEKSGRVVHNRAGSFLVAKRIAVIAGRIEGHRDGHGFLVPDDGGPDLFLSTKEMDKVLHGDKAIARVIDDEPQCEDQRE